MEPVRVPSFFLFMYGANRKYELSQLILCKTLFCKQYLCDWKSPFQ